MKQFAEDGGEALGGRGGVSVGLYGETEACRERIARCFQFDHV